MILNNSINSPLLYSTNHISLVDESFNSFLEEYQLKTEEVLLEGSGTVILKALASIIKTFTKLLAKAIEFYNKAKEYIINFFKDIKNKVKEQQIKDAALKNFKPFEVQMREYNDNYGQVFDYIKKWSNNFSRISSGLYRNAQVVARNQAEVEATQAMEAELKEIDKNVFNVEKADTATINELLEKTFYKDPEKKTIKIDTNIASKFSRTLSKDESNLNKINSVTSNVTKLGNETKSNFDKLNSLIPKGADGKQAATVLGANTMRVFNVLIKKTDSVSSIILNACAKATKMYIEKINAQRNILNKISNMKEK